MLIFQGLDSIYQPRLGTAIIYALEFFFAVSIFLDVLYWLNCWIGDFSLDLCGQNTSNNVITIIKTTEKYVTHFCSGIGIVLVTLGLF